MSRVYYKVGHPAAYGSVKDLSKHVPQPEKWLSTQPAYTMHKKVTHKFPRRKTIVPAIHHQYQADLSDFANISRHNKGHTFALFVIDALSRFLYVEPLKNKTGPEVTRAFAKILKRTKSPKLLQTDDGK